MEKDLKTINSLGILGSIINVMLFILKFSVGMISGSIAITTDAFNNLSDFMNTLITYFALKFALKPADDDHPYGHERFEIIAGFTVAMIMMLVAFESIKSGIEGFGSGTDIGISLLVVKVSVIAIVLKGILMLAYRYYGNILKSSLLKTNEYDSMFDVMISLALIIAYYLQKYVSFNLDALLGIIIGIIIFITAAYLLKDFISGLIGRKASPLEIESILNILDKNQDIVGYHDLSIHSYGKFHKYALVHVEVDELMSLIDAHRIVDNIEDDVLNKTGIVLDVHLDPLDVTSPEIKVIVFKLKEVLNVLSELINFHELRLEDNEIRFEVFNPKESLVSNQDILDAVKKELGEYTVHIEFEYINLIQDYKESIEKER